MTDHYDAIERQLAELRENFDLDKFNELFTHSLDNIGTVPPSKTPEFEEFVQVIRPVIKSSRPIIGYVGYLREFTGVAYYMAVIRHILTVHMAELDSTKIHDYVRFQNTLGRAIMSSVFDDDEKPKKSKT